MGVFVMYMYMYMYSCTCIHVCAHICCKTLSGMHKLHGRKHPNQGLATNILAVAVPTNPRHPMTSSTTSASRYGPLKFRLLSNS